MTEHILVGLAIVGVLSVLAQWVAWRIKLPSILFLLTFGILAGPVTHLIDPNEIMGDLLFPFISLSVAIILFEGGLSLRLSDLPEIGRVVRNLITIGALLTWIITTVAAKVFLDLGWELSFLVGAILVVTGPTVVIPLLNQIRPTPRVASILRWEGIVIDPVGAVLTVLVFENVVGAETQLGIALEGLLITVIVGMSMGWLGAQALVESFRRFWVPENLHNPMVLIVLIASFTLSNALQPESGLLTVTVMGIFMANQKRFDVRHIVEFKENLQVLLISVLFILLGARLDLNNLARLGSGVFLFIGVIILVARPLTVWISAYGSELNWKEKLFVSWMAPRGIVAASIASVFALELRQHGLENANLLVPIIFSVIISTVLVYSLTAGLLAQRLGLVLKNPQGVMFIGAHDWARKLAVQLKEAGIFTMMLDTNIENVDRSMLEGIDAFYGNAGSESIMDDFDLSRIGNVLAVTPNNEVNTLAATNFRDVVGPRNVFQLVRPSILGDTSMMPPRLGGKTLFDQHVTFEYLVWRFGTGAELLSLQIHNLKAFENLRETFIPLFIVTEDKKLLIWTAKDAPILKEGHTIIGVANPEDVEPLLESQMVVQPQQTEMVKK